MSLLLGVFYGGLFSPFYINPFALSTLHGVALTSSKLSMDADIAGWILEYCLRQNSIDNGVLSELVRVLPLPNHNHSLKKSLLIRQIESEISKGTISEKVLEVLELIVELDRLEGTMEVSEAMKTAYCAVAMHCTMRFLDGNFTNKEKRSDVVKVIWKDRAPTMERYFEIPMEASTIASIGLISEELRSWMGNIKAGVWDAPSVCRNASMMKYIKRTEVVKVVQGYVDEAKKKMGPPFLEFVAEKLSDDVMSQVMGVRKGHEERPQGGEDKGESSGLATKLLKRRPKKSWSIEEESALWIGVKQFGEGKWKLIFNTNVDIFVGRKPVDLKDKWRNMSRYEK